MPEPIDEPDTGRTRAVLAALAAAAVAMSAAALIVVHPWHQDAVPAQPVRHHHSVPVRDGLQP